jgi:hypothetical protein
VEALLGDGYSVLGIGGDKDRTLRLRYADLIAPMVKAIQEQQEEIAVLKARVAKSETLEAEIEDLRRQVQALTAREAGKPIEVAGN